MHYRREAFDAGLRAAGYHVVNHLPDPRPGDALLTWNRYGYSHEMAQAFERAHAQVFVTENGFLGKRWRGGEWFALCPHHHGAPVADRGPARWDGWQVDLAPFRTGGRDTIVFAQRGIGEPSLRSPDHWADQVRSQLGGRIRAHPGTASPTVSLEQDLADARQAFTWNSGAALHALLLGVPVWHGCPHWVGAGAARPLAEYRAEAEPRRDAGARLAMFRRLAWAMWTLDEVRTGQPFHHVLGR